MKPKKPPTPLDIILREMLKLARKENNKRLARWLKKMMKGDS
jgi:hypothetical protein